jgi:hypothetical protein
MTSLKVVPWLVGLVAWVGCSQASDDEVDDSKGAMSGTVGSNVASPTNPDFLALIPAAYKVEDASHFREVLDDPQSLVLHYDHTPPTPEVLAARRALSAVVVRPPTPLWPGERAFVWEPVADSGPDATRKLADALAQAKAGLLYVEAPKTTENGNVIAFVVRTAVEDRMVAKCPLPAAGEDLQCVNASGVLPR